MANPTTMQTFIADAATDNFNTISLKLHNLTEILKLAAFAAEARRTLGEIQDVARLMPDFNTTLKDEITNPNSWADLVDNTPDVLNYVASQLEKVNGDFTEKFYDLAYPISSHSEPEKIGGAV